MAKSNVDHVYMTAYLPAGAPEAGVELMGTYRGGTWSGDGLLMSLDSASGAYKATFKATEMSEFQFRELGNWYNKLQMTEDGGETWDYSYNFKVGEEIERDGDRYVMNLYLSDPTEFRWSQGYKQETDKTRSHQHRTAEPVKGFFPEQQSVKEKKDSSCHRRLADVEKKRHHFPIILMIS